ncbi:hypothetical protein [Actibacterium sp. MT2.3-13A]|uniref:hypothetical protein n=1 Tax=Actibacterium sp. MT2.3-13A TaxID=2828332 RepID=UPI001BA8E08C|nr:hypothetical protein [Actibacterium sp. MT2.3-13A]
MKFTLALLAASTAIGAALAIPASGAIGASGPGASADLPAGQVLVLASDDRHDKEHRLFWLRLGHDDDDDHHGDDDDDDDEDDECDDDDGDGRGCRAGVNPAPAGTVAPPANGLFGPGATPKAQVN